jgi:hypothetical protein
VIVDRDAHILVEGAGEPNEVYKIIAWRYGIGMYSLYEKDFCMDCSDFFGIRDILQKFGIWGCCRYINQ